MTARKRETAPLPLRRAAEDSAFEPEADAEAPRRGPNLANGTKSVSHSEQYQPRYQCA